VPQSQTPFDLSRVSAAFNDAAQNYDAQRRSLIPCFDGFYGSLSAVVDSLVRSRTPRVLDLGSGTGLSAAYVDRIRPEATLVLCDAAESMLEVARKRFARRRKVHFVAADYRELGVEGPFDTIVSALSIHHLDDPAKAALYRKAFADLAPGGLFVNADQVRGESAELEAWQDRSWREAIHASGLAREAIAAALKRVEQDLNITLSENLAMLQEAGFAHTTCFFREGRFAVFGGQKT